MKPISFCIIMKNEEAHLEDFLRNIISLRDKCLFDITLVDTGSDDNSINIANNLGIQVHRFSWCDDFSAARNYAASKAIYDWIFVLDCDETPDFSNISSLDMITDSPESVGTILRYNHFDNCNNKGIFDEYVPRIYNKNKYHYEGIIHEQLTSNNNGQTFPRVFSNITVNHYGYVQGSESLCSKASRNIKLLEKALIQNPSDPYIFFQLGQAAHSLGDEDKARTYYAEGLSYDVDENLQYVNLMVISYGYSLINTGHLEDALQFENIYSYFNKSADFVCLMGIIYLRNNRLDDAISEFKKATTISLFYTEGANSFIPNYNLGCINEVLGNKDIAIKYYEKCGNFEPAANRKAALRHM